MKTFGILLQRSVIARAVLALLVTLAYLFLVICHALRYAAEPPPTELLALVGAAWGYFFGSGAHKDASDVLVHDRRRKEDRRQ